MEAEIGVHVGAEIVIRVIESRQRVAQRCDSGILSWRGGEQRDRQSLQRSTYLKELSDLGGRQAVHSEHAARSSGDLPFLLQMAERLADRAATHSKPPRQFLLTEVIPWAVLA